MSIVLESRGVRYVAMGEENIICQNDLETSRGLFESFPFFHEDALLCLVLRAAYEAKLTAALAQCRSIVDQLTLF